MRTYEAALARYSGDERGRCWSCGSLATHRSGGVWHEVPTEDRQSGRNFDNAHGNDVHTLPACFRNAADLAQEFKQALGVKAGADYTEQELAPAAVRDILTQDRRCAEWYPYTPGFSAKEHLEQLQMMQLEEDRRGHDLALARLRTDSDERALKIAESLHSVTVETGKFTTMWTRWAFGVAVAGVVLALLAVALVAATYFFPDLGRHIGDVILGSHPAPTPTP